MATIITRAGKGSPLTATEVDANFTNLNNDIATRLLASSYTAADVIAKLLTVDGTGSGVDADLVDGLDTSSALPSGSNKASVIIRDSNGDFAARNITANIITASLTGNATNVTGIVAIANGGTNASTAIQGLINLGERTGATGSAILPSGTTAQRDSSPAAGYFRYNTSLGRFEGYNGSVWGQVGGATGGGSDSVFYENDQTITSDYTISTNKNAMTAGPVTINTGVTVTIPTGSTWSII